MKAKSLLPLLLSISLLVALQLLADCSYSTTSNNSNNSQLNIWLETQEQKDKLNNINKNLNAINENINKIINTNLSNVNNDDLGNLLKREAEKFNVNRK